MKYRLAEPDFDESDLVQVCDVLRSGWLIQAGQVADFESALGAITQSPPHVAVSSGTAALHVAMLALEIGVGDLVYIPSLAWPSAANIAVMLGALPIFVDVCAQDGNIDPIHLRHRIQESIDRKLGRPSAIVPVHAFGLACDIEAVVDIAEEFQLQVIEDAACSLGATAAGGHSVGMYGDIGIFSFHPRKSLTTGEGGSIVSRRPELLGRARQLRDHGRISALSFVSTGLNYRLTEFQAALGVAQAKRFSETLGIRRKLAACYVEALKGCEGLRLPVMDITHTWQTFLVTVNDKTTADHLKTTLLEKGIEAGFPSHSAQSLPQFAALPGYSPMPVSEILRDTGISLPLHARLEESDIQDISRIFRAAMQALTEIDHDERDKLVTTS